MSTPIDKNLEYYTQRRDMLLRQFAYEKEKTLGKFLSLARDFDEFEKKTKEEVAHLDQMMQQYAPNQPL